MDSDLDKLSSYGKKIKGLTDIQQCSIVSMLLGMEAHRVLPKGSLVEVVENFKPAAPQCCAYGVSKTLAAREQIGGKRSFVKENHQRKGKMGCQSNQRDSLEKEMHNVGPIERA